jgi:hypothetical protein
VILSIRQDYADVIEPAGLVNDAHAGINTVAPADAEACYGSAYLIATSEHLLPHEPHAGLESNVRPDAANVRPRQNLLPSRVLTVRAPLDRDAPIQLLGI